MEQHQPTWFSQLAVSLFGKPSVRSLLDTAQLIKYQTLRSNIEEIRRLTQYAYAAWNGTLFTSVFSSILIYYKYFKNQNWYSFRYLRVAAPLVLSLFYIGTQLFCHFSKGEIDRSKKKYFKAYQPQFMQHLNILKQKYGIDQHLQFEGVFNDEQLSGWIDGFFKKHPQGQI